MRQPRYALLLAATLAAAPVLFAQSPVPPTSEPAVPSPGPPAGPPATGDPGPVRVQLFAGVDLNADFWAELDALAPTQVVATLQERWQELSRRFGVDPREGLDGVTWLGLGRTREALQNYVVLHGSFDVERIWRILEEEAARGSTRELVLSRTGDVRKLVVDSRIEVLFPDPARGVAVWCARGPATADGGFMALRDRVEGGDPLDVAALRRFYGLDGTNAYAYLEVRPEYRQQLARQGGTVAALGSRVETLGLRLEPGRLQLGVTFMDAPVAQQAASMFKSALTLGAGLVQMQLQAYSGGPPPAAAAPDADRGGKRSFVDLLEPRKAVAHGGLRMAGDWLTGIEASYRGTSAFLDLNREKLPWLRASRLFYVFPTVTTVGPMIMAYQKAATAAGGGSLGGGAIPGMPPGLGGRRIPGVPSLPAGAFPGGLPSGARLSPPGGAAGPPDAGDAKPEEEGPPIPVPGR